MSLYSKAQNDQAMFLFPLDSTISNSWGYNNLTTSYESPDEPTYTTDSKTGNAAYVFNGTTDGAAYTKTSRSGNIVNQSDIQIEAVIKTTTNASEGNFRIIYYRDTVELGISSTGKVWARMAPNNNPRDITGSTTVTDGKWHHIVARWEGDRLKIYVDGTLDGTSSILNGTPYTRDTYTRYIGYRPTAFEKFAGTIDFVAEYYSYQTGILFDIANHLAEIANNSYTSTPKTASALMVQPVVSGTASYTSGTLTASSTSGDHYASTIDIETLLNTYMSTLSLEQWYRFDEPKAITNYGTGGSTGWVFTGNSNCEITSGIQGSGALRTLATLTEQVYGLSTAPLSTEFTDNDFSVGLWTKRTALEHAQVLHVSGTGDDSFTIYWNLDGYLNVNLRVNNQNHAIQQTVDKTDGNWHYVAARKSGNTLQMWVDGTSIGTTTVNHDMANLNRVTFGGSNATNTEQVYISQYYVGTAANITSTQIGNIWTYGQPTVQASAGMEMPKFSRDNALNTYILNNSPEFYFRMDEGSGVPTNSGSVSCTLTQQGTNFSQNVTSPNYKAYNFTNRDTQFTGSWTAPAGTFTTNDNQTIVMYAKTGTVTAVHGLGGAAAGGGDWGNGIFFQQLVNGTIRLRLQNGSTTQDATTSVSFADGNYHMFVGVKDGNTLKLYVDGIERASNGSTSITLTDSGQFAIAGAPGSAPTTLSRNLTIDEMAVFNTAFSAQDALEVFQKVANEMDWTASTTFVMPAFAAGFGPTIVAAPMTAASDMLHPQHFSVAMTAFATIQHPNFDAQVLINDTYAADPLTASALFHMPQYNIGEFNTSDHMDASALFVNPTIVTPGRFLANPFVAIDAILVMPGIVTVKGARVFADSMSANAFLPIPPAFFSLTDDLYYVRLLAQHATIYKELQNPFINPSVVLSWLKFFDDVTQDITIGSNRKLTSELPDYVFDEPGTYRYDDSGNIANPPTTKKELFSSGKAVSTPTPMLSKGYFDNQNRPAVRVDNIEFAFPETKANAARSYSLEFTINTTKPNQIIATGSHEGINTFTTSAIGLYNGKIYGMGALRPSVPLHPDNSDTLKVGYLLSKKRIDDGQWHHVVIQYQLDDGRSQIWIDGVLDRQLFGTSQLDGSNGSAYIRPYILGFNDFTGKYGSDFKTSVWSYDPGTIVGRDDIGLNYNAYLQYEPIKVQPMTASLTTAMPLVKGNRARALMLYFWSTRAPGDDPIQSSYAPYRGGFTTSTSANRYTDFDQNKGGYFDYDTFFGLGTWDTGRKELYDWDVFPVDVQGYYTSSVVKKDSYKNPYGYGTQTGTASGFRDDIDDLRYIDLKNDVIDIDSFDAIFFRNYPDQKSEREGFTQNEVVDSYFNIRENVLFENFLKSLRAAVDTGVSLFVSNPQLAIDLGIIDRIETATDLDDFEFNGDQIVNGYGDPYSNRRTNLDGDDDVRYTSGAFLDRYKNNRHRVVNTLTGLTDEPCYIKVEEAIYEGNDTRNFGEIPRIWTAIDEKPSGLTIGDEFMWYPMTRIQAVPLENIKAGRAITTFGSTYRNGVTETENPYRNYATTIAVRPGDVLNGTQVGGKIFVSFSEVIQQTSQFETIELKTDYWIDKALADETIDLPTANEYKALPTNLDRKLAAGTITQAEYNYRKFWDMDGDNRTGGALYFGSGATKVTVYSTSSGTVKSKRSSLTRAGRRRSRDSGTAGDLFNTYRTEWGFTNPTMEVRCLDMTSRGFIWLSERELYGVVPQRPLAATATAEMKQPVVTADKDRVVYAQAMVANASSPDFGVTPNKLYLSLPMYAETRITDVTKAYYPEPYTTTAFMPQNVKVTSFDVDQVVLYVMHEDAILYIREDVIK